MNTEDKIRESFFVQASWCNKLGSPFTAKLLTGLGKHLDHTTKAGRTILNWSGVPDATGDAIALRLAGALHGLVRTGRLPALSAHYPPNPSPEDNNLAHAANAAISEADDEICAWLIHAPQTNEVARSAVLYLGMMVIAKETDLPLSIFELGASAGLNLMLDRFAYQFGDLHVGQSGSAIRLAPKWEGPLPDGSQPNIITRCGCDLNPLDIADNEHRARLMAYVWPDQSERLARVEAAIEIARASPPRLDKADAATWVEDVITPSSQTGVSTGTIPARGSEMRSARVLFHSIAYQYFPETVKRRIVARMEAEGAKATPDRPLAWLALEQVEGLGPTLTLRLWRGDAQDGETRVLAKANNAHVHEVTWLG